MVPAVERLGGENLCVCVCGGCLWEAVTPFLSFPFQKLHTCVELLSAAYF